MGQPGHRLLTAIGNIRRFGQGRIIQSLIEDIKRLFYSFFGISLTYRERALSKNVAHYGPIEAFVYITLYVFMFPICLYQHNRSLCSYIDGQYMDRQVTCIILDKSIIQQIVHVTSGHMAVYGPVHILPYDPQCHELFAIYFISSLISQHVLKMVFSKLPG